VAEEHIEYRASGNGKAGIIGELPRDELARMIKDLESQMKTAARDLEFEKAALLRDQIVELRRIIEVDPIAG
jgi:excinuclease ABC subunit B